MSNHQETNTETTSISQLSTQESSISCVLSIENPLLKKPFVLTNSIGSLLKKNSFGFAGSVPKSPESPKSPKSPKLPQPLPNRYSQPQPPSPPMNGQKISELCYLFCCPPIPSTIAAKLAFRPPEPSYSFSSITSTRTNSFNSVSTLGGSGSSSSSSSSSTSTPTNVAPMPETTSAPTPATATTTTTTTAPTPATATAPNSAPVPAPPVTSKENYIEAKLSLNSRAGWEYPNKMQTIIEVCWSRTSKNNRIACMYVKAVSNPKFVILFSHGNATDLGQMSSFYLSLGRLLTCNVFSYDYSGYGVSTGRASERNLYADIECAWNTLRDRYGFLPSQIILYGQSIGTVPTVDLASRYMVAAVILHSPLMSGFRIFKQTKRTWFFDVFPTIDKIHKVTSPVLVIHGTDDEIIDISHGLAIYEKCVKPVEPLWIEGGQHNDCELYGQYLERLRKFINHDLEVSS